MCGPPKIKRHIYRKRPPLQLLDFVVVISTSSNTSPHFSAITPETLISV